MMNSFLLRMPIIRFSAAIMLLLMTAIICPFDPAQGQETADDSPFADAEVIPHRQARCSEVARWTKDQETSFIRRDFSVVGKLALVHHDGTLAYLGLCGMPPEPKVMCITYQTNDLQVGDEVVLTGGYSKLNADYILLDPCLASRSAAERMPAR